MQDIINFPLFLTSSLLMLLTPGPAILYITMLSITKGRLAGVYSIIGISLGGSLMIIISAILVSTAIQTHPLVFSMIKYGGTAFLFYLGIKSWRSKPDPDLSNQAIPTAALAIIKEGFIVNVLNAKAAMFFIAFFPQFINPDSQSFLITYLKLGGIFVSIGVFSDLIYVILAGWVRQFFINTEKWITFQPKVAGSVYLLLGIFLLVS